MPLSSPPKSAIAIGGIYLFFICFSSIGQ